MKCPNNIKQAAMRKVGAFSINMMNKQPSLKPAATTIINTNKPPKLFQPMAIGKPKGFLGKTIGKAFGALYIGQAAHSAIKSPKLISAATPGIKKI